MEATIPPANIPATLPAKTASNTDPDSMALTAASTANFLPILSETGPMTSNAITPAASAAALNQPTARLLLVSCFNINGSASPAAPQNVVRRNCIADNESTSPRLAISAIPARIARRLAVLPGSRAPPPGKANTAASTGATATSATSPSVWKSHN